MEKAKKDKKLIKFSGGFYRASLHCGEDQIYAFNGFFISMHSKFVAEGLSIYEYLVDWKSSACALGVIPRQSVGSHGSRGGSN